MLMMKTQIGLGVLSIPSAFDTLGVVPGVIVLIVIAGPAAVVLIQFEFQLRECANEPHCSIAQLIW